MSSTEAESQSYGTRLQALPARAGCRVPLKSSRTHLADAAMCLRVAGWRAEAIGEVFRIGIGLHRPPAVFPADCEMMEMPDPDSPAWRDTCLEGSDRSFTGMNDQALPPGGNKAGFLDVSSDAHAAQAGCRNRWPYLCGTCRSRSLELQPVCLGECRRLTRLRFGGEDRQGDDRTSKYHQYRKG